MSSSPSSCSWRAARGWNRCAPPSEHARAVSAHAELVLERAELVLEHVEF